MHSMMLFTSDEFKDRVRRARQVMTEQKIDALLVSQPQNIIYMTGYRTNLFVSNFRPYLAIIPLEGDPTLLMPLLELGVAEELSWIDDIRAWGPDLNTDLTKNMYAPDSITAAKKVIEEKKLTKARIGTELGLGQRLGLSPDQFEQLKSLLPDVKFVDATPVFWKVRGKKSPKEVEYLREASRITDKGYEAVLEVAREGVTERELQAAMGAAFMREGSDFNGFIIVNSGKERYKMMNPWATDRKLQKGDMCIFDFGAVYNNYWSDLTRGFFVGEASKRQREFYEISKEATALTAAAVKPGVTCESIDAIAEKFIEEKGYRRYMMHRTGHSIGVEVHEIPSIGAGEKTVMEPGMTFAIEPGIYDFSIGSFRVEDIVTVTEKGMEYLSKCERELTVV
jgi:Xaa-Pro aminopeptidase